MAKQNGTGGGAAATASESGPEPTEHRGVLVRDPELVWMGKGDNLLQQVPADIKPRVMAWLVAKHAPEIVEAMEQHCHAAPLSAGLPVPGGGSRSTYCDPPKGG